MKKITNKLVFNLTLMVTLMSIGCSPLGGFTRSIAAEAIEQSRSYPAPAAMTIDIRGRLLNAGATAWQISKDDTAEAAAVRAKEGFMQRQPQIIVAEQLGFLNLYFEKPELGPRSYSMPHELYLQHFGIWEFHVRAELTETGRKLWQDLSLPENPEELPLAVRDSLNITGMSDANQTMKRVEFTYKWKPTELGEAFDPAGRAFAKLPEGLREALQKTQRNMFGGGNSNTADYNTLRRGVAHFKKFDDGWRISDLSYL
ncbi:MAG: hypothetical protein WKF92_14855 [Pyrinomonadaceae bacterium]